MAKKLLLKSKGDKGDSKPKLKKLRKAGEVKAALKPGKKLRTRCKIDADKILSTGSTLLDLAISGGRIRGGGLPGGILIEIFGPSASGKTAVAVEIGASAQEKGGEVCFADPEARLDKEYAKVYGLKLSDDEDMYCQPDLVMDRLDKKGNVEEEGLESFLLDWEPDNEDVINVQIADSIAQLSTEMETDGRDKRGQRKAKELSEVLRKSARILGKQHRIAVFTNQEKQGEYGGVTPGGKAIGFAASVRIRLSRKEKLTKKKKMALRDGKKVDHTKVYGILSEALIKKSSIDDEYRTAPIYILFGIGIDDVRANLTWYKDKAGLTKYLAVDKEYAQIEPAIAYIEDNNLEADLREMVIDLWEEIEEQFKTARKKKVRF